MVRCELCRKRIWRLWQGHVHGCEVKSRLKRDHGPSGCPMVRHTACGRRAEAKVAVICRGCGHGWPTADAAKSCEASGCLHPPGANVGVGR